MGACHLSQIDFTMFYKWLFEFSDVVSAFNVFRYITFRSFLAFVTSFTLCWAFAPYFIRRLNKRELKERVSSDGPRSHSRKNGTPTMGGGLVLCSLFVTSFLWVDLRQPLVWGILSMLVGFGMIGFWDDFIKIRFQNFRGLSPRLRLCCEFGLSLFMLSLLLYTRQIDTVLYVPFFKDWAYDLSWFYVLLGSFVITGTANSVNLTDGLDGLAIVPVMVCAGALGLFAYVAGHFEIASYLDIPFIAGAGEIVPLAASVVAAGLGFLWYNSYPAQIFMGDVGSLGLGAFLGTVAVFTKNEILLFVLGGVFVVETLSVIIQVMSFKLTGRRVFKMAPLHHHFELKGVEESKIIVRFWIVACLLAALSLVTLKLR